MRRQVVIGFIGTQLDGTSGGAGGSGGNGSNGATDATATLQRGDAAPEDLPLAAFAQVAGSSIWNFLTSEFELEAEPGQVVPHKVVVAAKTTTGERVSVSAELAVKRL